MGLYDDLKKNLDPATFAAVTEQMGEDYDYNQVPYSRLQKVVRERNELRDKTSNTDPNQGSDNGDSVNSQSGQQSSNASEGQQPAGLTQADLQKAVVAAERRAQAEAQKQIAAMQLRSAALLQLRDAGCIDAEVLYDSVRIDKSVLSLDTTGKVEGLAEQITALQNTKSPFFAANSEGNDVAKGTGKKGVGDNDNPGDSSIESKQFEAGLDAIFGLQGTGKSAGDE